eukprot:TRINITY_DN42922_c0_g1_i1.p2 TRINITY_DN42922_c0_g1~~TRINITY_DN42922_c0_g1_i1.p2  ORF type:complete len:103 (+),score=9.54 TRINITY_DN42922_c0_g1_i1:71-379(+)
MVMTMATGVPSRSEAALDHYRRRSRSRERDRSRPRERERSRPPPLPPPPPPSEGFLASHLKHSVLRAKLFMPQLGQAQSPGRCSKPPSFPLPFPPPPPPPPL